MNPESKPSLKAREIISFFLAPAVPLMIWFAAWGGFSSENTGYRSQLTMIIFVILYGVAAGHALLLGLPAYLLGKRLNGIRWWTCLFVGFLIGGLPITILTGWGEFIPTGLLGASAGLFFWLLWRFWISSDQQAEL